MLAEDPCPDVDPPREMKREDTLCVEQYLGLMLNTRGGLDNQLWPALSGAAKRMSLSRSLSRSTERRRLRSSSLNDMVPQTC
jgi:hypothetical protein